MKKTFFDELCRKLLALIENERRVIPNLANAAALLFHSMEDVSWAGFYLVDGDFLVLGPFQGKPACISIHKSRGVCGAAFSSRKTVIVEDVHSFNGHIACDSASNSEIVVPILCDARVVGVLDIDSTSFSRFDAEDAAGLERFVTILQSGCDY